MDEMGTNFSIQADLPEIVYQDDKVVIWIENLERAYPLQWALQLISQDVF